MSILHAWWTAPLAVTAAGFARLAWADWQRGREEKAEHERRMTEAGERIRATLAGKGSES